jgi:hypothetical protein
MKNHGPVGGVEDAWVGHPHGDRTTVAELKSVPGLAPRRPLSGGGGSKHANPNWAEFDRIHSQLRRTTARRPPRKNEEPPDDAA